MPRITTTLSDVDKQKNKIQRTIDLNRLKQNLHLPTKEAEATITNSSIENGSCDIISGGGGRGTSTGKVN